METQNKTSTTAQTASMEELPGTDSYSGRDRRDHSARNSRNPYRDRWNDPPYDPKEADIPKKTGLKNKLQRGYHFFEKYLPLFTVAFFIGGVAMAQISPSFATFIDGMISGFINGYGYVAPPAIYFILTPALLKIIHIPIGTNGKKFGVVAISFFAKQRLLACLWACLFTTLIFGLPLYINGTNTFSVALIKCLKSFGWMATHSIYFYAFYAAILTVLISLKLKWIEPLIQKPSEWIEASGKYLVPIMPFFMLAIGSYVAHLNVSIVEQVGAGKNTLHVVSVFGLTFSPSGKYGMLWIYLIGAGATALACWIWHLALLSYAKFMLGSHFSLKTYFAKYWPRVYPLLWATSSESLGMPLNLHLVKTHFPKIPTVVRRFCIGGGSFLSINGTMICVFVLAGVVSQLLGIKISLLHLLMMLPIVFLMGYGVPGIPGELILFGGPIVALLGLSPELAQVFITIYVGMQIGLPDSFRSATNSTDNCISAHLMNHVYQKRHVVPQQVTVGRGSGLVPIPVLVPLIIQNFIAEEKNQGIGRSL
ncbi:MAG TPA: hypothetical protein DDW49_11435 [Deltaproteobacteria bacterium]|nr:MAG: hypothetical protein A2048_05645 [Deltaproteobacteria bacterium GWA2_45_12]HBF13979.1 hypothetical protein [Deltaproteobacteria bacterium]